MDRDEDEVATTHDEHMDGRISSDLDLNVEHESRSPNLENIDGHSLNQEVGKSGVEFDTDELAYSFYNKYAELVGFSVRKDWVNRSKVHGRIISRKFTCSRQGHRKKDRRDANVKKHRKETRTGCLAHMLVTRQHNGKYRVTQFELEHNHDDIDLTKGEKLLESHLSGKVDPGEFPETDSMKDSEVRSKLSLRSLGVRFCPPENLDELQISDDIFLSTGRTRDLKEGDGARLLYYFQRQHFENPSFVYSVQLDIDDKLTNMFWADDNMVVEYSQFGDVVCLDTSSMRETDLRPFVLLIGLNHHRQVVIFGAAFLYDDSVSSFKWLFRTFIETMSSKKPKFVLSDQDATIVQAIHAVLPETSHCMCAWQMYLIALKHLYHVTEDYDSFATDLRSCIFCHEQEEDFIQAWDFMLEKYDLCNNAWLKWMFREKEKWASVYGRNTFFIERDGTHLVEQMADKFRSYLSPDLDVLQFFRHFASIVNEQRYKELESTFDMGRHAPVLMANAVLLKEPSLVYTPKAFEVFQREYEKSLNVVIDKIGERDSRFDYKAKIYGKSKEYLVSYNSRDGTVCCNCLKFEHAGFLCSHALKLLDYQNIKIIPSYYILKRWTKDAQILPAARARHCYPEEDCRKMIAARYKDLCRNIIKISARAAASDPAFDFAARQLDEVMHGVERILNFKPNESARDPCASENNLAGVNLARNDFEGQDDILTGTDETESIVPDNDQPNNCDGQIPGVGEDLDVRLSPPEPMLSVACAPSTYISSHSPTARLSPLTQGLYNVDANHMVQSMYQTSNLTISQQPNLNMYEPQNLYTSQPDSPTHAQFLQEPLMRNQFQDPVSNGTQLKQVMDDGQHPLSSSFSHYNSRYRAPGL